MAQPGLRRAWTEPILGLAGAAERVEAAAPPSTEKAAAPSASTPAAAADATDKARRIVPLGNGCWLQHPDGFWISFDQYPETCVDERCWLQHPDGFWTSFDQYPESCVDNPQGFEDVWHWYYYQDKWDGWYFKPPDQWWLDEWAASPGVLAKYRPMY